MTTLFACNKDDDGVDPNDPDAMRTIKLSMRAFGHVDFQFEDKYEEDIPFPTDLSVDWGDGSITSSNSHYYNTSGIYNVTIQAKNLKRFGGSKISNTNGNLCIYSIDFKNCNSLVEIALGGNNLKTLDVTGLKVLEYLGCQDNDLISLDIKGCSSLRELECSRNELSAEALNKIFNDLPQGKTWTDEDGDKVQFEIEFYGNPGSEDCDISILEKKGWEISRY